MHSRVAYDVIGKIAETADLTRKTVGEILSGMEASVFGTFQKNPEQFISEASRIIREQKATTVIEHLTYDAVSDTYETDKGRRGCVPGRGNRFWNWKVVSHPISHRQRTGIHGECKGAIFPCFSDLS